MDKNDAFQNISHNSLQMLFGKGSIIVYLRDGLEVNYPEMEEEGEEEELTWA